MNKKIVRFFNLRINSQDASFENLNIGPNLSPFMNREKINLFCLEFNSVTSFYLFKEIPIFCKLILFNDGSFILLIKGPSLNFFLKILDIKSLKVITLKELFYIVLIKNNSINNLLNKKSFIKFNQIKNAFFSLKNLSLDS